MADHPQGSIPRLVVLREIGVSKETGGRDGGRVERTVSSGGINVVKGAGEGGRTPH